MPASFLTHAILNTILSISKSPLPTPLWVIIKSILYKSGDAEQLAEYAAQVCQILTPNSYLLIKVRSSDEFDGHTNFYLHQTHEHHHH